MFKCIFLNENFWIPIEISLKIVPKDWINNKPAFFHIMAWYRPGDKPLSEPMMVSSLTHIGVTRPQWVIPRRLGIAHLFVRERFPGIIWWTYGRNGLIFGMLMYFDHLQQWSSVGQVLTTNRLARGKPLITGNISKILVIWTNFKSK